MVLTHFSQKMHQQPFLWRSRICRRLQRILNLLLYLFLAPRRLPWDPNDWSITFTSVGREILSIFKHISGPWFQYNPSWNTRQSIEAIIDFSPSPTGNAPVPHEEDKREISNRNEKEWYKQILYLGTAMSLFSMEIVCWKWIGRKKVKIVDIRGEVQGIASVTG